MGAGGGGDGWEAGLAAVPQARLRIGVAAAVGVACALLYVNRVPRVIVVLWATIMGGLCAFVFFRSRRYRIGSLLEWSQRVMDTPVRKPRSRTTLQGRCTVCDSPSCKRHRPEKSRALTHPWEGCDIPVPINEALEGLIARIIQEYVRPWYDQITEDETLLYEIKQQMRHVIGIVMRRFVTVDLIAFTMNNVMREAHSHLHAYLQATRSPLARGVTGHNLEALAFKFLPNGGHRAVGHEREYLRSLFDRLLPHLLSPDANSSTILKPLLRETLISNVVLPTLDALSQPHFITNRLAIGLGPGQTLMRHLDSDESIELLSKLCARPESLKSQVSAFDISLFDILGSQRFLKPFMDFMKRENAIQMLLFYLDIESFIQDYNKPVDAFTEDRDVKRARQRAREMFKSFLQADKQLMRFDPEEVQRLETKLARDDCLVDARDFVLYFDLVLDELKGKFCPQFLQSDCFYTVICGERQAEKVNRSSKQQHKRKKSGIRKFTKAELEKLKLPPPPSATPELHSQLSSSGKPSASVRRQRRRQTSMSKDGGTPPALSRPDSQDERMSPSGGSLTSTPSGSVVSLSTAASDAPEPVSRQRSSSSVPGLQRAHSDGASDAGSASISGSSPPKHPPLKRKPSFSVPTDPTLGVPSVEGLDARIKLVRLTKDGKYVVYTIEIIRKTVNGQATYLSHESGDIWTVDRRFSDFFAMDKVLKTFYPDYSVHLPEKRTFGNLDKQHVQQRRKGLAEYLQGLLRNQLVLTDPRCTAVVYSFLKPNVNFKKILREFSKKSMLSKVIGHVPPVWVARKLIGKVERSNAASVVDMYSFAQRFAVTAEDVEQDREAMMEMHLQLLAQQSSSSEAPSVEVGPSPPVVHTTVRDLPVMAEEVFDAETPEHSTFCDSLIAMLLSLFRNAKRHVVIKYVLAGFRLVMRDTVDAFVVRYLSSQLDVFLADAEMLDYVNLLTDVVFGEETEPVSAEDKAATLELCKTRLLSMFDPLETLLADDYSKLLEIVDALQHQKLNKQLLYVLLDGLLTELFPELLEEDDPVTT